MTTDWRVERDTALLRLERETSGAIRAEAASALCDLAFEAPADARQELAPAIVRLLTDRQDEVRCAGLALAAELLEAEELQEIFTRHLADRAVRVRVEAAGRLADLALPELRGVLALALADEELAVRFEAARGMAALKHQAGLEVLLAALDEPELRYRAAASLAQLGNRDALPRLKKVFRSWFLPDFERTQLAAALAKLGDAEGVRHLFKRAAKGWSMDRAMAVEMLGEVKAAGALERLAEILADPKDQARGAAARGLGRLGGAPAVPVLLAMLDEPELADDLRLDVAEGLLRLGSQEGRARVAALDFTDADSRAELAAMLAESP